jgi:hypothetical protein
MPVIYVQCPGCNQVQRPGRFDFKDKWARKGAREELCKCCIDQKRDKRWDYNKNVYKIINTYEIKKSYE